MISCDINWRYPRLVQFLTLAITLDGAAIRVSALLNLVLF